METLTEVVRSSKQIKIQGFSLTSAMPDGEVLSSRAWNACGYKWEVHVLPNKYFNSTGGSYYIALNLYFRDEVPKGGNVKASFGYRLIDPSGKLKPYQGYSSASYKFNRSGDCQYGGALVTRNDLNKSAYLKDDAFTIECTLAVLRELDAGESSADARPHDPVPSSGLNHHLGELLEKGTGADVTLVAAGESFAAHKAILASRSPIFMAEFFGHMKEKRSPRVEIKDMEAAVLGAMLRFIYTDSVSVLPEPDEDGDVGAMHTAQHLLAAADRYGIDRLKLACENRLYDGVGVDTAATTLALAEQHGCCRLKAKCVDLIAANLEAVMGTDGYRHLTASCPAAVMGDLLMAVHGRKN